MKQDKGPQERARLIESILECLRLVNELHTKLGSPPNLYKFLDNFLRAQKCSNIAKLFYKNELYIEALGMHHQVNQLLETCLNK